MDVAVKPVRGALLVVIVDLEPRFDLYRTPEPEVLRRASAGYGRSIRLAAARHNALHSLAKDVTEQRGQTQTPSLGDSSHLRVITRVLDVTSQLPKKRHSLLL